MIDRTKKQRVLIVDDTPANIHILMEILKEKYIVSAAINGERGLKLAAGDPAPDIILLDIMMPGMDGYEVCAKLKAERNTANIPIIFVTALTSDENEAKGLELGALDYITKPFNPALVRVRVQNHLELKRYRDQLEEMVRVRTEELMMTRDVTIESLGTLAEYRDPETGGHIKRTQNYIKLLACRLKDHPRFKAFLSDTMIENLCKSAPLHDIGKVGVRDSILLKPGKLTPEEFEEMKKHTIYGMEALDFSSSRLGDNSFLRIAKEMAYTHHERWDGSGYPQGLQGEKIPIPGRIMALADVYDALISKRIYKPSYPHQKAVEIIRNLKHSAFDPAIVDVFLELEEEFRLIALNYAESEEERNSLS